MSAKRPRQNHRFSLPPRTVAYTPAPLPPADPNESATKNDALFGSSLTAAQSAITFTGAAHFRLRILLATLSGVPVHIHSIRLTGQHNDGAVGVTDCEVRLLRLIESVTNGAHVRINASGTAVRYTPGLLTGHSHVVQLTFDCGTARAISYYLFVLLVLAPFTKRPLDVTLTGITADNDDPSIDTVRAVTVPLLKRFGASDLSVTTISRGAAPGGGGAVRIKCSPIAQLNTVDLSDAGRIKRVRGMAHTVKCSSQLAHRVIDGARGVLNALLPDVYIFADAVSGLSSGHSVGWGCMLYAESLTGALISAEQCATESDLANVEEFGAAVARRLIAEVALGGTVDSAHQSLAILMAALAPNDVSRIRIGALTDDTVDALRLYRQILGVVVQLKPDAHSKTILCSVMGTGYRNFNRKIA